MNSMKHLLVVSVAAVASALAGAEIDGNEWQDQTRLSLGKEAPRAAFFTYPDEETARRSFWGEAKPWKTGDEVPFSTISLDYASDDASASPWRFKWSKDPASRPVGFQSPNYDISGWEGIIVPCSWQAINARGKFKGGWESWGQAPVSPLIFATPLRFPREYAILLPFLGKDAVVAVGCKGEPLLLRMRSLWSQGDEKGRCGCRRCVALA